MDSLRRPRLPARPGLAPTGRGPEPAPPARAELPVVAVVSAVLGFLVLTWAITASLQWREERRAIDRLRETVSVQQRLLTDQAADAIALAADVDRLRGQLSERNLQLVDSEEARTALDTRLGDAQRRNEALGGELDATRAAAEQAAATAAATEAALRSKRREHARDIIQMEQLKDDEIIRAERRATLLTHRLDRTATEAAALDQAAREARERADTTARQLEQTLAAGRSLQQEHDALRTEAERLTARLREAAAENTRLRFIIEELQRARPQPSPAPSTPKTP